MERGAVPGLPDDILVQILSRVSAKDLHRSKCVSKAWCGLVAEPLYRKDLPQTLHGFFYGDAGSDDEVSDGECDGGEDGEEDADGSDIDTKDGVDEDDEEDDDDDDKNCISPGSDGSDIDTEAGDKNRICPGYGHFINLLGRSAHLVDPTFSFLKRLPLPGIDELRLLGSCNGLLLFGHEIDWDSTGFIVCNPATEQWAAVPFTCSQGRPPTDWNLRGSRTHLVFDPAISSHFHLVMFLQEDERPTVHAYHSETGAWSHSDIDWTEEERKISHLDLGYLLYFDAAVVNGMLYLILKENKILQVDFQGKTRGVIPAPSSTDYSVIFVGQSQGRLNCVSEEWGAQDFASELSSRVHIGDANYYDLLSIWVLDDNGTHQWVLKHSVSLFHLFGKLGEPGSGTEYSVVAIHPDRNLVFIVQNWNWQLISYDMDSKKVCALGTLEHQCRRVTPFVPCFLDFVSN